MASYYAIYESIDFPEKYTVRIAELDTTQLVIRRLNGQPARPKTPNRRQRVVKAWIYEQKNMRRTKTPTTRYQKCQKELRKIKAKLEKTGAIFLEQPTTD